MIAYAPVIFLMEFAVSWLLNSGSIAILARKPKRAVLLSVLTNVLTWASFFIIGKISDWNVWLISASILGDVTGDFIVSIRKPKKKKPYLKRIPTSTA
jgi:hypothetical protein